MIGCGNSLGRTDLGYPEDSAVIEFDGKVKYQNGLRRGQTPSDAVIVEKKREDAIRSAGVAVLRIVWSELAEPARLADRITENRRQGRSLRAAGVTSGSLRSLGRRPDDVTLHWPSARCNGQGRCRADGGVADQAGTAGDTKQPARRGSPRGGVIHSI